MSNSINYFLILYNLSNISLTKKSIQYQLSKKIYELDKKYLRSYMVPLDTVNQNYLKKLLQKESVYKYNKNISNLIYKKIILKICHNIHEVISILISTY